MRDNKYNFQKLTPKLDADIEVYDEALNFIFENNENDDVKNIAISGAYSSGKSSIIESYKAKHPEKQFIHLSLAHFRSPEEENAENMNDVKESVLEGKILNQLIHQVPVDKIPQTNFRVKSSVDKKNTNRLSMLATLIVISVLFVIFYNNMIVHINSLPNFWVKNLASFFVNPYSSIIVTTILVICCAITICKLVKIQKNKNIFSKISVQGNEIEIFEEQDESYFDKYLNEVLYLFENIEADVIVFEDMDRFNANRIFERLREINTLINIHRKKHQKENYIPLRFFYLIRDDIFISRDRTKFFDYIVPVVPIVDSSNSYGQIIKHLKKGGLLEKFDLSFLQGLSLYIDDMRILKNMYNEFVVYFNRLNTTDLDCNKMLAMIAYKNIFPRDFSNLQLKQGFVFEVFNQKKKFIADEIETLTSKKTTQLDLIEKAKNDFVSGEVELRDVYDAKKKRLPGSEYQNFAYNADSKKKAAIYDQEHEERKKLLQYRLDDKISELDNELYNISCRIDKLKSKMLKDIISRVNINNIFSVEFKNEIGVIDKFVEIRGSEYFDLLKYLIRNGLIDETYSDYMTYFHEHGISANDKIFLRRITDKRGAEYTYELKEPLKVISSPLLRGVDFEEEEVLNFDLMKCLLDSSADIKFDNYIKTLISQLNQNEKFDFITQYYDKDISHGTFVMKVNEYWSSFFCTVLKNKKIPKDQIRRYSIETLYYCDDQTIESVNIDGCLKNYISASDDYLQMKEPDIANLISKFKLLGVLFVTLNYDVSENDLFKNVYHENLYEINFINLKLMLQKEYLIDNEDDIVHKNYSLIQSDFNSPLAKYVADNLSEYIDVVLQSCAGEICDDLREVTYLLNCGEIDHQQKQKYINVLTTMLNDLSSIEDTTLWQSLLIKNLIIFDEQNVMRYYSQFGIGGALIDYINSSDNPIDFTDIKNIFGEDIADKFFDSITSSNDLDTDKYIKILLDLQYQYNIFEKVDIQDEKVSLLIAKEIILMTVKNLLHLREHYSNHVSKFIQMNLDRYLALQTKEIFDLTEALQVIELDFEVYKKIEFISLTTDPISILNKGYEDTLCVHILTHNLVIEDLNNLYQNYQVYQGATKEKIIELATTNISELVDSKAVVDDLLLSLLFQSNRVDFSYKIKLFNNILPKLNEEQCKVVFDEIGVQELKEIFTQWSGRKKYSITDEHTGILDVLKNNNWIYEYKIDEQNHEKYTIIKNVPKHKE